jgi:hypothetical protein
MTKNKTRLHKIQGRPIGEMLACCGAIWCDDQTFECPRDTRMEFNFNHMEILYAPDSEV